ncbi:MAG: DUF4157 domain-containing protein [Acidimicrobiales bacterium]|nr:DUF4157 domain-containing protein [Acidimicrobiia bacterium]NNC81103.1 DUF4157 domain-containing protein [Acidimicrobiales bacterium]RZV46138.1 MAG: DUF4157 domain-containing protein [Acidimicrobiales bacterium]
MSTLPRRRRLTDDERESFTHINPLLMDRVRLIRTNLLPPAAHGMTLGPWVLLRGDRIGQERTELIAHELVHVQQFVTMGSRRFVATYVAEYLRNLFKMRSHRAAYLAISLEEEARRLASEWRAAERHKAHETG